MEVFCKFRTVKRILRLAIAVLLFTFHSVSIYGEYYLWTGEGADAKWTTIENWVTFDENDNELPATKYPGKNQADNDSIEFSGENENYIIVDKTVYLDIINFNTVDSNRITLEFLESTTTCNSNIIFLVDKTTNNTSGNVVLTGPGTLITREFDFPNQGGNHEHTFVIGSKPSDNTTTLTVTTTLWANSEKKLTFSGNGYLYMPLGGGNVNYGGTNITYALDITHRLPYKEGVPTYSCNIDNTDFPIDANKNIVEATITLTKPDYGQPSEESVYFPYTVEVTGNQTYTLYGEGNSETFTTGEHIFQGKKSGTTEYRNNIAKITRGKTTSTFKLALAASDINSLEKGNGIKIIFYSPDGQYPQETFMELGRLVWYYKTPVWTGNGSTQDWTDTDNWEGISGVNLNNLSDYDIEISVKAPKKTPVISNDVSVKSITITSGSNLHLESGKLSTNKIETSHLGSSFTSTNNSIVELANKGGIEPVLKYAFNDSSTINIKNLSIAEGASFTMPLNMDLSMLTINSGASFYKGDKNLSIGWLEIQTANYSDLPSISKNINITEDFEADCIIILLRDGNITTTGKLSARKDFIIGGARYNYAIIKYDKFIERPSDWVQSYTDIDLSFSSTPTESSTFKLAGNAEIRAGTSGKGNFYINGANLEGNPSGGNNIVIPQNDSAENFCADAIFSNISNINVVCSDGTTDGTHAQIPTGGCTLSNCKNFDSEDFTIVSAKTVSDNRILIKFSEEVRNNKGELNFKTTLKAIKASDSHTFTAAYGSETGTDFPDENPTEFYLYTKNTSWNADATGINYGSGKYTNSKGQFKKVKPSLRIPQSTAECGFIITNKWGKRLNDYNPYTETTCGIQNLEDYLRRPPKFGSVLCPIGGNTISITFTKPIVTNSKQISYRIAVGDSAYQTDKIDLKMESILPRCFELISIDAEGSAIPTDLQINKNKKAQIDQYPSGLVVVTLQLTRNATLEDIEKLYIRLTTPKYDDGSPMYTPTTFDHVSMTLGTNQVSFIQESDKEHKNMGATFMLINTAHTISDFVINAVSPSYAYSDVTKNIYDSDSIAVHDFSKNQQNYGTLPYGYEFTLISKINLGTETAEESDYPGTLKLFITDSPDSQSLFTTFNANFNRSVSTWLPESTVNSYSVDAFDAYTKKLNPHFWDILGSPLSTGAPSSGYNFIIPKETVTKMKAGSQLSFLYALCDENGTFIPHYLSPECNYTSDPVVYTLPESTKVPLFAFNITNANDLLSLDQWYIKLKNITEQRGGVTILNNVINSAAGEKTTLKVNMAESGKLDVIVMTLDGNIIKYLNRGNVSAGEHYYNWDGKNKAGTPVARGMYFIIVKAPGMDETRKVMVVK